MKIKIKNPYALNEIGRRDNNEDSIYPNKGKASSDTNFFIVCDGIGGHYGGEIASDTVCRSFSEFLNKSASVFNENVFQSALDYAYERLNKADSSPDSLLRRMGTTFTFLHLGSEGAFMAHIGDSRIYHLRKEGDKMVIRYKSQDHSLVNELLRSGNITPEEAKIHPQRNIITRAMQSHQEKPDKAEIQATSDVKAGDYFFLCSDGILESIDDAILMDIISDIESDKEKMDWISQLCLKNSRDNYSAYLIPIDEVVGEPIKDREARE
ncbi:MAG: protein phosphatase 2C domain-containing protein [Lentimicrobiaceae bacterium]|jgi:serine/threonine protein phosphatase PrpC|nr:protein phosphatase 2C domain-containing protein [Lentimicrobiaceae bacterium]